MLNDDQIIELATFMGWHISEEFIDGEYVDCWIGPGQEQGIPVDWWNPDSDMSDAWMLIDKLNEKAGSQDYMAFKGFLALSINKDKPEFGLGVSVFDLTPETICQACLRVIDSKK